MRLTININNEDIIEAMNYRINQDISIMEIYGHNISKDNNDRATYLSKLVEDLIKLERIQCLKTHRI